MSKKLVSYKLTNVGDYAVIGAYATDDYLIEMWLKKGKAEKGKSENTKDAYRRDIDLFRESMQYKPLQAVILDDLQSFKDSLEFRFSSVSSRVRVLNAVKSLFSFAMKTGYFRINPAVMLDTPTVPGTLAARILTEEQVMAMLTLEQNTRNRAILRLLYEGALRVSELCALTWSDIQPNAKIGGQVTVTGKGGKTRSVPISQFAYDLLLALRTDDAGFDERVFTSARRGTPLSRVDVYKFVKAAAEKAGVHGNVSPHWLRHAHASHALDRGAPVHLVKETLGHANIVTTNNYAHARPSESSSTFLFTAHKTS